MTLSRTTMAMRVVLGLAATLVVGPVLSMAGLFDTCCVKCRQVRPRCCCPRFCPPPQPAIRMEPVTEQVPVTTFETVCVDEGSFKQVWVPRVVAKQVPKTVVHTRIRWRPVAVNPCPVDPCPPGAVGGQFVPGAAIQGAPTPTFSNETFSTPGLSVPTLGAPGAAGPTISPMGVSPMPTGGNTSSLGTDKLVPMPTDSGAATPILPRNGGGTANATGAPTPILPRAASKPSNGSSASLFSAPPSAAMVWRSQINATR